MPHYPVTKQFCFTLCIVKCGLVSERVTRANSNFFINEILNFRTVVIFQLFHLLIQQIAMNIAFFCSFCKIVIFYSSRKNVWKLTVTQTSTVPQKFLQDSCAPTRLFWGFVLFWGTKRVSLNFALKKTPDYFKTFLSVSSKPSTMQDILRQNSIDLKIEGRKSFT